MGQRKGCRNCWKTDSLQGASVYGSCMVGLLVIYPWEVYQSYCSQYPDRWRTDFVTSLPCLRRTPYLYIVKVIKTIINKYTCVFITATCFDLDIDHHQATRRSHWKVCRSCNTQNILYCPSSGVAWQIPIAVYTVLRLLMMDSRSVRNM